MNDFELDKACRIKAMPNKKEINDSSFAFMKASIDEKYSYNFNWFGRPIIQYPQDMIAMQELILDIKPDLIIETGIAHGGSLVFSASMLALLDMSDAIEREEATLILQESNRKVLGIDIDIRSQNKELIEMHPMSSRIQMIEGSSTDKDIIDQVKNIAKGYECVLVCLDSNHTHEHVLAELEAYAPLTSIGSYCVVFDTIIEDMPADMFSDRPWGAKNNPKTAVWEYVRHNPEFKIDNIVQGKLLITVAPDGFLRRIK